MIRSRLAWATVPVTIPALAMTWAVAVHGQPAPLPGSWSHKAPLPVARNEVAAVALNDKIYVLGGSYPGAKYDVADNGEDDPATGRWRARASKPHGLNHVGPGPVNGNI